MVRKVVSVIIELLTSVEQTISSFSNYCNSKLRPVISYCEKFTRIYNFLF